MTQTLRVGRHEFTSRLILGTGKYATFALMDAALAESGTQCVTVAVRRVPLGQPGESVLDHIPKTCVVLPNTAGCFTAEEAVRTARLAREFGLSELLKLEVLYNQESLLAALGIDRRQIAVERNQEIVPRAEHATTPLAEGDRVEIVTMVGGG